MPTGDKDYPCPNCGDPITSDSPLWVWLGKWYCQEKCVRAAMVVNR